jgi:hypothetical protein
MARIHTQFIDETECIGDSLDSINNSFQNLDTSVQDLSAYDNSLKLAVTPNGSNLTVVNNLTAGGNIIASNELRTNTIRSTTGVTHFVNGYPRQPGQIIERLTGVCNGSQVIVGSGTYTMPNVTTVQDVGITVVDVNGSIINYTPPTGTTRVIYEFDYVFGILNPDPISHFSLFIDNIEVVASRTSSRFGGTNPGMRMKYIWVIPIGGTSDTANSGRQSTWTTPKQLKLRARSYDNTNYRFRLHSRIWWNGVGDASVAAPILTLTSIA